MQSQTCRTGMSDRPAGHRSSPTLTAMRTAHDASEQGAWPPPMRVNCL